MSITREFSKRQVSRLRQRLYDPSAEQIADLETALGASAEDEEHAREVIGILADDASGTPPTAADIRRIAHETRRTETRPSPACQDCHGSGWRTVTRQVRSLGRIVSATGAERCSCWSRAARLDSGAASSSVDVDLGGPQRLFKEAAAGL